MRSGAMALPALYDAEMRATSLVRTQLRKVVGDVSLCLAGCGGRDTDCDAAAAWQFADA